jgi:hypothetical protein
MLLASTLVPIAHEGWSHEMQTITDNAGETALIRSGDLDRAARQAAELGPVADLRHQLRRQGVRDGLVLPVIVISPGLPNIRQAWRTYVRDHILAQGITHYGLSLRGDTLAVVFARRLFTPDALPSSPSPGTVASITGTVDSSLSNIRALVGRPDELVSAATVSQSGDTLRIDVTLDSGPGTYMLELIGTTERGPEVIAMIPLPTRDADRGPARSSIESADDTYGSPSSRMIQLVNRDRRRLGLTPLRRSETLSESARRHAVQMARTGFAAHVLPGGKPPADRLARFDVATSRFHENVAMASSVDQAHTDLWASPSHRRALLDPTVNRIGVGVETVQTGGGPIHFVVQHLAEL